MNNTPQWVSTTLKRENIHAKPIKLKDRTGREMTGHLEVERVGENGQMVIRACYNPSPYAETVMLTAFRLTQAQMDAFAKDAEAGMFNLE